MKLIACLNIYNERENLPRCIEALRERGIFSIIVVDGVYRGYPHPEGREHSTDGTWEWLGLHGEAMGLLVAGPPEGGWPGQEIKRTKYLRLADTITEPGDWLLQVDADEFLVEDEPEPNMRGWRVREFLENLPPHIEACWVHMYDVFRDRPMVPRGYYPKLLRWQPGLFYGREHWDVLTPNGQRLWRLDLQLQAHDAALWPYFCFEHRTELRDAVRMADKSRYEEFRIIERLRDGCMNPEPTAEV